MAMIHEYYILFINFVLKKCSFKSRILKKRTLGRVDDVFLAADSGFSL